MKSAISEELGRVTELSVIKKEELDLLEVVFSANIKSQKIIVRSIFLKKGSSDKNMCMLSLRTISSEIVRQGLMRSRTMMATQRIIEVQT